MSTHAQLDACIGDDNICHSWANSRWAGLPDYAKNLLPPSVVSRPLEGDAPTIDIAVGYSKSNTSPVLELFVSRIDELVR